MGLKSQFHFLAIGAAITLPVFGSTLASAAPLPAVSPVSHDLRMVNYRHEDTPAWNWRHGRHWGWGHRRHWAWEHPHHSGWRYR